jgi:hypothetical protein
MSLRTLLLAPLLGLVVLVPACDVDDGEWSGEVAGVKYTFLEKKRNRATGRLVRDVLVDPKTSKEDVMKLAEGLRRKYTGKLGIISIFDSREAWERQGDPSYPTEEFYRHCLVAVEGQPVFDDGKEEVRWIAEGRKDVDSAADTRPTPRVETEAEPREREVRDRERQEELQKNRLEAEQREREARDRQRREELRKNKPEQDARQVKEEAAYRLAQEEASSHMLKEQAAYRAAKAEFDVAKAEFDAARKLNVGRGFAKSSDDAKLTGDDKAAGRFARTAREKYLEIVKDFYGTLAARDAQELLRGKEVADRPLPPEPQPVKPPPQSLPPERLPTERLTNLMRCVDLAVIEDWGSELQQIPATVIDKGVLKHIPYQSFRAGDYEFNVYGDPDRPACLEIGVRNGLLKNESAKEHCVAFIASLLPDAGDRCLLRSLNRTQEIQKRGSLTFEVTPETAEDAYGGWWVSVYDEAALNASRATARELEAITERKDAPPAASTWTPDDLKHALPSASGAGAKGDRVYVGGYYRKDGTYVQAHTRSLPGSGSRKK